jgi:hypothetical protein
MQTADHYAGRDAAAIREAANVIVCLQLTQLRRLALWTGNVRGKPFCFDLARQHVTEVASAADSTIGAIPA